MQVFSSTSRSSPALGRKTSTLGMTSGAHSSTILLWSTSENWRFLVVQKCVRTMYITKMEKGIQNSHRGVEETENRMRLTDAEIVANVRIQMNHRCWRP